jgi:hypothetical protein
MTFRQYPPQSLDLVGVISRVISPLGCQGMGNHEFGEDATRAPTQRHDERLTRN